MRKVIAALGALLLSAGALFVGFLPAGAADSSAADRMGWGAPIASDEFNYTGAPDPAKWQVYDGPGHHNQGVRSPAQITVADGYLTIKGDEAGTTGGLSAKFNRTTYARWEARMRVSQRDSEYHPVLILWPADDAADNCDEVDYSEGTTDTTLTMFYLHYECAGNPTTWAETKNDATQWHNYAVDWSAAAVVGYIDGVEVFRDTVSNHIPRAPMKQTIQLDWFPDGSALQASWLQVDWVRAYAAGTG